MGIDAKKDRGKDGRWEGIDYLGRTECREGKRWGRFEGRRVVGKEGEKS